MKIINGVGDKSSDRSAPTGWNFGNQLPPIDAAEPAVNLTSAFATKRI
jgi:hypothetical protein